VHPRDDRCPGVLRLTPAADGGLARVRLPGGLLTGAQLRVLAGAARDLGDGRVELTSRGNVQLRSLTDAAAAVLEDRLAAAGLLPSTTHDRVRNVIASPLAGIAGGHDLTDLVRALDVALCERPALAELSGRFLFALDDGRGDVACLDADVVAVVRPGRAWVNRMPVERSGVVDLAIAVAEAFLAERAAQHSDAWRIADLSGGDDRIRARLGRTAEQACRGMRPDDPVGEIAQDGGGRAVAALAPLGRLTADQLDVLAELAGPRGVRVTPWRSVVVPDVVDGAVDVLAQAGFGVDTASRWLGVTACAGRPGCAKSLADVQADAARDADRWPGLRVHWSGCARQCGRPVGTDVDVVATENGYVVKKGNEVSGA